MPPKLGPFEAHMVGSSNEETFICIKIVLFILFSLFMYIAHPHVYPCNSLYLKACCNGIRSPQMIKNILATNVRFLFTLF